MTHIMKCVAISLLAASIAGPAIAAGSGGSKGASTTSGTTPTPRALGQPNDSCGSATAPSTPGNAADAFGSAFNPAGVAGMVYAGQQPQNSNNPASVSQYDVACARP